MTTVEVLRKARALYAANPSHAPVSECPDSGAECVATAIMNAQMTLGLPWNFVTAADKAINRVVGTEDYVGWNATHSTEEVLAAFDRAIEAEERAA